MKGLRGKLDFFFTDHHGHIILCDETNYINVVDPKRNKVFQMNLGPFGKVVGVTRELLLVVLNPSTKGPIQVYCRKSPKLLRTITGYYRVGNDLNDDEEYDVYITRRTSISTSMVTKLLSDASEKFVWAGVDICAKKQHRCIVEANKFSIQLVCVAPFCWGVSTVDLQTNGVLCREILKGSSLTISTMSTINSYGSLTIKSKYGADHVICHKTGQTLFRGRVSVVFKEYLISQGRPRKLSCYIRDDNKKTGYYLHEVWGVPTTPLKSWFFMGSKGIIPNVIRIVDKPGRRFFMIPLDTENAETREFILPVGKYISCYNESSLSRLTFDVEKDCSYLDIFDFKRDKQTIKEYLFS